MSSPEPLKSKPRLLRAMRGRVAVMAMFIVLAVMAVSAGLVVWTTHDRVRIPSCSWPLRIHGGASADQAGLVRCYLQALARRDSAGLMAVAANDPPVHITKADLRYSPDARAGEATANFVPTDDSGYVVVTIIFANGARERTGIIYISNGGGTIDSCDCWRMHIGTFNGPWARATYSPPP
jgi:hypothetical protein